MSDYESTTLNAILTAACGEFLKHGFQGASLRHIVKQAGVTTGAFYGYFDSKEALFDALVKEPYHHLLALYRQVLTTFAAMPPEEQRTQMADYTRTCIMGMTDYIYAHFDAFKLLLCGAEGTRYENLIHDLAQMDCDATRDFSQTMHTSGVALNPVNPYLEHILTSGMFYAYFELVVHDIPQEHAAPYIHQLVDFYQAGWQRILGF